MESRDAIARVFFCGYSPRSLARRHRLDRLRIAGLGSLRSDVGVLRRNLNQATVQASTSLSQPSLWDVADPGLAYDF